MNDFLQQLRSGGKRFDRSRKSYDGNHFRGNERNGNRDRKNTTHRKNFDQSQLQGIKKSIDAIAEGQKSLQAQAQNQNTLLERIAKALEAISDRAGRVTAHPAAPPPVEKEPVPPVSAAAQPPSPPSDSRPADREKVADIICNMRNDGKAFDEIARHLNSHDIPTLSGRGAWRSQVVSRLYNQRASAEG